MHKPLYKNERTLFLIALVISLLLWAIVIYATKGIILVCFPIFFLIYLFAQSGFISYLKGTGAIVSDSQFPDIQEKVKNCAQKVGMKTIPKVYILHGNGLFNAFATRFLRKNYIILLSDVLDALEDHPDGINFYIGHEMGHIDRKHLIYEPVLSLGLVFPLLGAAYSRAREYTCDLYGAACSSPESAQKGLALLAVGAKRYKTINIPEYIDQIHDTSGFWMSFHELIGSYPWLVKRFASISPGFVKTRMPTRNPLAYIPAIFVPRLHLTSLIIIYVMMIALTTGGVLKGEELIANAEKKQNAEFDNPVPAQPSMSTRDILNQVADEVNKTTPQQIDDVTTLNSVHAEGEDSLVYDYTISLNSEDLDFSQISESVYSSSRSHWCDNEDTQSLKNLNIKVIYNYADILGTKLGDVVIDTAMCDK